MTFRAVALLALSPSLAGAMTGMNDTHAEMDSEMMNHTSGTGSGGGHAHTMFAPLACNDHLAMAACDPWTSKSFDLTGEVVIPCGECVTMDVSGDLTLPGGLNVIGKLHFPPAALVRIATPHVFVQGELSIDTPDAIVPSPSNKGVEFHMTGDQHVMFVPHGDNMHNCDMMVGCDVSKKPVAVAGGKLDVRGVDETCPSWVRLQDVVRATPVADPNVQVAPTPKASPCTGTLLNQDFEDSSDPSVAADWSGNSATHAVETDAVDGNNYLRVSGRTTSWHGPSVKLDIGCAVPDETYLLSYRFRMHNEDGSPTTMESNGGSHVPYINLLRRDVSGNGADNGWITAPTPRGIVSAMMDNTWHSVSTTLTLEADWVDPSKTAELLVYLNALDGTAVVDIDDVKLELKPAAVFPSSAVDSCASLLRNSGFEQAGGNAYPFAAAGGIISAVSGAGDGPVGSPSNSYAQWTARASSHSALNHPISAPCLADQEGAAYEFKASYRVHSPTPRKMSVQLKVTEDDGSIAYIPLTTQCPESVDGVWAECSQVYTFRKAEFAAAVAVELYVTFGGDDASVVDLADVSMDYASSAAPAIGLIPDDPTGVASCWGAGAEVLVTSHTIQWDGGRTVTVSSVDPTTGTLTLSEAIPAPTSLADDPMAGVELALLSRNVRFVSADDDAMHPIADGHGHGGHLIVLHTPAPQVQLLRGAEMRGFGQQGNMGRYPIHFHMCDEVMGSVVDKNVVRDSNQRCVVIHNSDMLTVSDNVAYNTAGHCFILEDGGERKNTLRRNLGATTRAVQTLINENESDNMPSTYWLLNPDNDFVENVAAGSDGPGYWFEVKATVRGPSGQQAKYDGYSPREQPLKLFKDNVAHSNRHNGLQTYPQSGYRPPTTATFENFRSYKNAASGVFFHAGGRLALDGGYFADNRIGVDIDADHSDVISNSKVVGVSADYAKVIARLGAYAYSYPAKTHCAEIGLGPGQTAIRLDSYYKGGSGSTGTHVSAVEFEGFAGPGACPGSVIFDVDETYPEFFDPRNTLDGLTFADATSPKKIDLATAYANGGVEDAILYDKDGSLMGTPNSFVVSDTAAMTSDPRCSSVSGTGAAHCTDVCLRSIRIAIPYSSDPYTELHITGTNELGDTITPHFVKSYNKKEQIAERFGSHRHFFAYLPEGGTYQAQFQLNGNALWPTYADLSYEDAPGSCGADFASFVVDTAAPPAAGCDQLITNGDAGEGTAGGSASGWQYMSDGPVVAVSGGADGTGYSLSIDRTSENTGSYIGLAQHLDTRCLTLGAKYHFQAKIKLTKADGSLFECVPMSYNGDQKCPSATLRPCYGMTEQTCSWPSAGYMVTGDQEWNIIEGTITVDETIADAGTVSVYINGGENSVNIQMDSISMTPYTEPPTESPTGEPTASPVSTGGGSVPDFHATNSDYTSGSVSLSSGAAGDTVMLHTTSGADSTIMTKDPHSADAAGNLELTVQVTNRVMYGSGYQGALALFFAPPDANLAPYVTNDNGYANFEKAVVATVRDKLYPTIDYVWMHMHYLAADGSGTAYQGGGDRFKNMDGYIRLTRDAAGFVTGSISPDGINWKNVGGAQELPVAYKTGPLKLGMRVKKEWKSEYQIEVLPSVSSGGATTTF